MRKDLLLLFVGTIAGASVVLLVFFHLRLSQLEQTTANIINAINRANQKAQSQSAQP